MRTNLKSSNNAEKIIIDYLEENASDMLVEKINRCNKPMSDCFKFITSQAKKKQQGGCACISDAEVFGWAVHYYEEEGNVSEKDLPKDIKVEVKVNDNGIKTAAVKEVPVKEKKAAPKDSNMLPGQMSIFDFMGV